jgi:hypothetical protein
VRFRARNGCLQSDTPSLGSRFNQTRARQLFDALLDARDKYGAKKPILEDQDRKPLSYTDLIRAASRWAARSPP